MNREQNFHDEVVRPVMASIMGTEIGGKWHEVKIEKVTNGFIVKIGCKTFVATSWHDLSKKLGEYWADPKAAEKKYVK